MKAAGAGAALLPAIVAGTAFAQDDADTLAKQLSNPVASLIACQ